MIENLIVDLCGPLLVVDASLIDNRLHSLGVKEQQCYRTLYNEGCVKQFDCGVISTADFCEKVRNILKCRLRDDEILDCWNDLIVGFDIANIDILRRLHANFKLFLLSNSDAVNEECFRLYINNKCRFDFFDECFDGVYFSNKLHLRKPDPEVFLEIVRRHGLDKAATLVVDDCEKHCLSARSAGMAAWQCKGSLVDNIALCPEKENISLFRD